MSVTSVAGKVHKWLALLLTVPILFWFGSGFFFALVPIDRVSGEHRIREQAPVAVPLRVAGDGLRRLADAGVGAGDRIEIRALGSRPVALVTRGEARPRLYDLVSGARLSPITRAMAAEIATRDHVGRPRPTGVTAVFTASPEYRGALPAWRVDFTGDTRRSLYVAADTGVVTARRSTLWRVYDFLWALHILDFEEHQDFNTPLLIAATALSLILLVTGVILFPERLGLVKRRRRRSDDV